MLHAYDATNLATELYNSTQAAGNRDTAAAPVKLPVATVANGKVFVPTVSELDVYGLLASNPARLAPPTFTPAPGAYAAGQTVTLSAAAGATIYYTLDGSQPTLASSQYTGAISVGASTTIAAMAVQSGSLTSTVATGAYTISSTTQITYVQSNYATPQTAQTSVPVKYSAAQQPGGPERYRRRLERCDRCRLGRYRYQRQHLRPRGRPHGDQRHGDPVDLLRHQHRSRRCRHQHGHGALQRRGDRRRHPHPRVQRHRHHESPRCGRRSHQQRRPTVSSGSAATTHARDLIIGADLTTGETAGPGAGFTARMITVPDADLVEDMTVASAGSYSASAVLSAAAPTIMQMVAFKAAATDVGSLPTAPTNLVATATGVTGVSLTWGASSESGGTITQYLIERCAGSSCTNFTQVNTSTSLSFSDSGLTGATSYSYRVRAKDASAHTGPYSNIATATTATPIPTAPTNLAATASGATQVNLSWGAASEAGGAVTGYLIERCQGAGCTSFTQVGTAGGLSYSDSGLANATSYSYRVRATDAASHPGPYSNNATATTATASPSAPTSLAVTAGGTTQLNLSWGAASESGGSIAGYLIERCQGAGCSSFVQVAGPVSALTYSNAGLSNTTSYSYRVRARDGAGTMGPYSNIATGTTPSAAPSAPSGLAAVAAGSTQVNLSWGAASEAGGSHQPVPDRALPGLRLQRLRTGRCLEHPRLESTAGLPARLPTAIGCARRTAWRSWGRIRTLSTASTAAAVISAPTAPTASAAGASQIALKWEAATETGGTISQYRIERCQGAGCTNFAQVATSSGLASRMLRSQRMTTYRYRIRAADAIGNVGPYSSPRAGHDRLITALVGLPGTSAPGAPLPPHGPR